MPSSDGVIYDVKAVTLERIVRGRAPYESNFEYILKSTTNEYYEKQCYSRYLVDIQMPKDANMY